MKKMLMMLAAVAMVLGLASCSNNDDNDSNTVDQIVDLTNNVVGSYAGATVANSAYFSNYGVNSGTADSVIITKVETNVVDITYKSNTWGTATFNNVTISQNDTAYVFSSASDSIAMKGHTGSTTNYAATFSGYMLKNGTLQLHVKLQAPAVMGGTTLNFTQNDLGQLLAGTYYGATLANSTYFKNFGTEGQVDTLTITKASLTTANIKFKSGTWGTAIFKGSTITENDTAYVFSEVSDSIAMPGHNGTTSNYPAKFSGYVLKNGTPKLKATVEAPTVMGGTTMTFTTNK